MLEIILVIAISKKIAAMMAEKGRSAAGYIVLFVMLWFGFEIIGAIIGTIITASQNPRAFDDGFNFMAYIFALAGAAVGGTIGYVIASSVPPLEDPRRQALERFDKEEEEERTKERQRRRDAGSGAYEKD